MVVNEKLENYISNIKVDDVQSVFGYDCIKELADMWVKAESIEAFKIAVVRLSADRLESIRVKYGM